jgi:hypothetical protein
MVETNRETGAAIRLAKRLGLVLLTVLFAIPIVDEMNWKGGFLVVGVSAIGFLAGAEPVIALRRPFRGFGVHPTFHVTAGGEKAIMPLDDLYDRLAKLKPGERLEIEGAGFVTLRK